MFPGLHPQKHELFLVFGLVSLLLKGYKPRMPLTEKLRIFTVKLPLAFTRRPMVFGTVAVLFLLWVIVLAVRPKAPAIAAPIEIFPSLVVDERLFLLRELNELNTSWPDENLPATQLQSTLDNLRQQAAAIRNHLREGKINEQLAEAYDKFIQTLNAYTTYLEDIGKVQRVAENRAEKEASEAGFRAGYKGAEAGYDFSDGGGSTSGSLVAAEVVALGSYLWDDYQKGKERDETKREASEAAHAKLTAAINDYTAFCRSTALALSNQYGWKKGEAGFDEPPEFSATVAALLKQGNTDGIAQVEQTLLSQRPRDPFVMRDEAYFASLNPQESVSDQVAAARRCMAAASLIPAGAFYDGFREQILVEAGNIFDRVAAREIGDKGWGKAFNKNAAEAVQIWTACVGYQSDVTGELRERKAWDLFKSGDLKGALATATPLVSLRQNDLQFLYNMACLLSDTGDAEHSLVYLKQAVQGFGFNNIAAIKADPDLATVRAQKSNEIADLVAVRCAWKINYGMFNDDLIIKNDSPFTLTHIVVDGSVIPNNNAWKALTVDTLPPGQSYTWSDALSVPGSKVDASKSTLSVRSDQGECQLLPTP